MKQMMQYNIGKLTNTLKKLYINVRKSTVKNKLYDLLSFLCANYLSKKPRSLSPHKKSAFKNKKRFRILFLFFIILFSETAILFVKASAIHQEKLQEGIAENIIRFHVIANSDSNRDQELKLKVKEALVETLSPKLEKTETITGAYTLLEEQLPKIKETAEAVLQTNGCSYPVTVTLNECFFPLKVYGEYTFPPGYYEALRVRIGAAEGQNWWCVMFPPLCFVDETYAIIDEDTKEQLKHLLTEEEFETLSSEHTNVKIKFKILEELKKLF